MKIVFILFVLSFLFSSCALFAPNPNRYLSESEKIIELRPFVTDYCSKYPDGRADNPKQWADCCFSHDLRYWLGGTEKERKNSDMELKKCVKYSGNSLASFLMYIGVRFGGNPGAASYAWGYGWTQDREYHPLEKNDLEMAKNLLKESSYNQNKKKKKLIYKFISETLDKNINK